MNEQELRALRALTLLVAACEQASLELEAADGFEAPLMRRITELHEVAIDVVRSRLPGPRSTRTSRAAYARRSSRGEDGGSSLPQPTSSRSSGASSSGSSQSR